MADDVPNDRELINKYLAGDGSSFSELAKRYQNMIYNLSYRLVGIAEEAEDLTQEIFIRLLDKVVSWRGEAKFSTWLYRLALNHCRDHLRRRRLETTEINDSLMDSTPGPDIAAQNIDTRSRIEAALMNLPIDSKTVIYLRDIEGFSYSEIAEILEIELGTVKSRLARARLSLANELAPIKDMEQTGPPSHQRG